MPARPTRRRSEPNAGPTIADDRSGASLAQIGAPATENKAKPRKFTALLDGDTDARFGRLLADLRSTVGAIATREDGNGRTRAGYDPSRADLLRALLVVAEEDPRVGAAVFDQVKAHYHRPDTSTS